MDAKTAQIRRIKRLQALVNKDRAEYTAEDRRLVRGIIEKHIGTDWVTTGWESSDNDEE